MMFENAIYACCICMSVVIEIIGILSGILTPSAAVRIAILIVPAFLYRRSVRSIMGISLCTIMMVVSRLVLTDIMHTSVYSSSYQYYCFVSGWSDIYICVMYYIGTYIYIVLKTKAICNNATSIEQITDKNRIAVRNYMYLTMVATIVFVATGIKSYGLKYYWVAIVVFIFIAYNIALNKYNSLYVNSVKMVMNKR